MMTRNNPPILLSEAFSEWFSGKGIFSEMEDMPWEEDVDGDLLDVDYFGNHSGAKKCAPIVYKLMSTDHTLSDLARATLASIIEAKFRPNWEALWFTFHAEYNPLDSTSMTEIGESHGSDARSSVAASSFQDSSQTSDSFTHGETVTEVNSSTTSDDTTLTHGETVTEETEGESAQENLKYGFNSSVYAPVDKTESDSSQTTETAHTGMDSTERDIGVSENKSKTHGGVDLSSGSDSRTASSQTSEDGVSASEKSYSKTISGVDGMFTRQRLIKEERELWKDSFFDKVYSDVDTVLTSMVYLREHERGYFMNTGRNV